MATSSEHGYLWDEWPSFHSELAADGEVSQSYAAFCRGFERAREWYGPSARRQRVYVVHVGNSKQPALSEGDVELIGQLLQCYLCLDEPVLPLVDERLTVVRERGELGIRLAKRGLFYGVEVDERGRLLATDVLNVLRDVLPEQAVSLLGLVDDDLYEWADDEAQFWGRGCGDRVAVVSSYRFRAAGGGGGHQLARLANVCVHELCHTFQLDHCGLVRCLMNASEPQPAALDDTLPLCPVCLPKLQRVFGFDDVGRHYAAVAALLARPDAARLASPRERDWYARRGAALRARGNEGSGGDRG